MSSELQQIETNLSYKPTVLIVDDSKVIRLALSKILKKDFEVVQAVDGEDGWDKLNEDDTILAVFSDVSMPNLDGFELLERVRSSEEARIANVPYIIITANDDDDDFHEKVMSSGGNDLITKPFKTNEITHCVQRHINIEDTALEIEKTVNLADSYVSSDPEIAQINHQVSDNELVEILGLDTDKEILVSSTDTEIELTPQNNTIQENLESSIEENSGFAFTINESFFNSVDDTEQVLPEMDLDLDIPNENVSENTEYLSLEEEATLADISITNNESEENSGINKPKILINEVITENVIAPLSFEITTEIEVTSEEKIGVENVKLHIESSQASSGTRPILNDKKMELEQSRKRAMDIARAHEEDTINDSAAVLARRASETDGIRKHLEKLRQMESGDNSNENNHLASKTTSFFKKIMRIISGVFLFRK